MWNTKMESIVDSMTRAGDMGLRGIDDGIENVRVSGDSEFEAENQSSDVAEESGLIRGHQIDAVHAQQQGLIETEEHTGNICVMHDDCVERLGAEQDQALEQQQAHTPVRTEEQVGWGGADRQEDSWNSVETNEPSGWDCADLAEDAPQENVAYTFESSSGWGYQFGESEPAPFVDLGYFDRDIVILGSSLVVRVAYTAKGVEDWIAKYWPEERLFGVDIEWRPNQIKGEDNKAALFQIAGKHGCLIVQLLYIDRIPDALRELLADPNAKLAGVGVRADSKKLFLDYGLQCKGEVDLGLLAADVLNRRDLKRAGLATLCDVVLGIPFKKIKSLTVSNWAVEGLSLPQITYAASDACIAYSLLVTLTALSQARPLPAQSPRSSSPKD